MPRAVGGSGFPRQAEGLLPIASLVFNNNIYLIPNLPCRCSPESWRCAFPTPLPFFWSCPYHLSLILPVIHFGSLGFEPLKTSTCYRYRRSRGVNNTANMSKLIDYAEGEH